MRALGVTLGAVIAGCTAAPTRSPEPRSKQPHAARTTMSEPRGVWEHWAAIQNWPRVTSEGAVSRGHLPGRGLLLDVRVDPSSRDAYSHWVRDSKLEPGAIVVALLRDPKTRAVSVVYAMEKRDETTWTFLVLSSDGRVEPSDAACAGCHADAVADFVFGPPSP